MEIVTENKTRQQIKIELDKDMKEEYYEFVDMMKKYVEKQGQKIEGTIEAIRVEMNSYDGSIAIKVQTLERDNLKLLTSKPIDVKKNGN